MDNTVSESMEEDVSIDTEVSGQNDHMTPE